jgi:hypothetical protein
VFIPVTSSPHPLLLLGYIHNKTLVHQCFRNPPRKGKKEKKTVQRAGTESVGFPLL